MKKQSKNRTFQKLNIFILAAAFSICGISVSFANMGQMKLYKEAFPGTTPKCIQCHMDKVPKKDDGMHDPNAYGAKIREEGAGDITVETYKKVGTIEDFEAQAGE